jgi:bifunctional DNase/RNase
LEKAYIKNLALDIRNNSIVVIVGITGSERYFPIWIGTAEGIAIAMGLGSIETERPLTHKLIVSIVDGMGGTFKKVVLSGMKDSTYYALLHIEQDESIIVIDSRPSDSLAIASRTGIPIEVAPSIPTIDPAIDIEEHEIITSNLKPLNPDDLFSI